VAGKRRREDGTGAVRRLPSGSYQARYRGPDGLMRAAGMTWRTKLEATMWLEAQARDADMGNWQPPAEKAATANLNGYAEQWLQTRDLKPRTRADYRKLLDLAILPALGDVPLERLSPTSVRAWYASLDPTKPTWRAHAYSLLRTICATAVTDDLMETSPCRVRGAGSTKKKHMTKVASLGELEVIVGAIPERYRAMVLLAAWCGLRFGELTELRRGDLDLEDGLLYVNRGVVRAGGRVIVGDPKSEAGKRRVTIPPHLLPMLEDHLRKHTGLGATTLLFPARHGGHMAPSALYTVWYPAREKAGRPDLRFHDLRHTGATLAAATGATLADLMGRLGHSTPAAALRYQHVAEDRDRAIAEALSGFAVAKDVPLKRRTTV
jgi:integrase